MSPFLAQVRLILRNDLRLLWRDLATSRWRDYLSLSLVVVLFIIANVISIAVFFAIRRQAPLGAETVIWLFFGFAMLGTAMTQAITVLFERADFDLLLVSPVSPRAILLARLATMFLGAALSVAIFLLPLLNGALFALSWHYVAGYAVWLLLAGAVASAGVWFTLLLVRWLGARRARTWAQVVAGVLGASVYLVLQTQGLWTDALRGSQLAQLKQAFGHPLLTLVARAGRGEWPPLLALAAVTVVFTALTTRLLARMFIGGLQEAGGIVPARRRSTRRHVFAEGVARATFWKDVRLILRDPLLLAQVLPTMLYILPVFFVFRRFGDFNLLAPLALILATQFSICLTAVAASGEECWDLIRMSPTAELRLRLAKMAAGMALPLALSVTVCLALALLGRPGLALIALVFSVMCAAGCAWLQVARITPTPRHDILRRNKGASAPDLGRGFLAAIIMLVGAAGLGLVAGRHWLIGAGLLGLMTLSVIGCFTLVEMEAVNPRNFPASSAPDTERPT